MFNKKINNTLLTKIIDFLPYVTKNEELKKVITLTAHNTINDFNIRETNSIIAYPIKLALALPVFSIDLAYELSVIWYFFYESAQILDSIQDKDYKHHAVQVLGPEQGITLAVMLSKVIFKIINHLKIHDEYKQELTTLFYQCQTKMLTGQYYDLRYTNTFDAHSDPIANARLKAGPASGYAMQCIFTASGMDGEAYYNIGVKYGVLKSILNDYCDIWLYDYSKDLANCTVTMPILAALNDGVKGETSSFLLAGNNFEKRKQVALRRYLSSTQAIEIFELYYKGEYEKLNKEINTLEGLNNFKDEFEKVFEDCRTMIQTLYELRSYCKDDPEPMWDLTTPFYRMQEALHNVHTHGKTNEIHPIPISFMLESFHVCGIDYSAYLSHLVEQLKNAFVSESATSLILFGQLCRFSQVIQDESVKSALIKIFNECEPLIEKIIDDSENKRLKHYSICLMFLYYGIAILFENKRNDQYEESVENLIKTCLLTIDDLIYPHQHLPLLKIYASVNMAKKFDKLEHVTEKLTIKLKRYQKINGSFNNSLRDTALSVLTMIASDTVELPILTKALIYLDENMKTLNTSGDENYEMSFISDPYITRSFCLLAVQQGNDYL